MPYRNIHWIKLEIRLQNDPRFFTMSETAQLYYIKLLMACGQLTNQVPKNFTMLQQILRSNLNEENLLRVIKEIQTNFPKVSETNDFYKIKGFKEKHNWVLPRSSEGSAKEHVDKIREEEDKIRRKTMLSFFCDSYKDALGNSYIITYGKDQRLMKDILESLTDEEVKGLILRFFESKDPFVQKAGYTIGVFKSQINKLRCPQKEEAVDGRWGDVI